MGVPDYSKNFTYLIFKAQKYHVLIGYTVSYNLNVLDRVSTRINFIYISLLLINVTCEHNSRVKIQRRISGFVKHL